MNDQPKRVYFSFPDSVYRVSLLGFLKNPSFTIVRHMPEADLIFMEFRPKVAEDKPLLAEIYYNRTVLLLPRNTKRTIVTALTILEPKFLNVIADVEAYMDEGQFLDLILRYTASPVS